MRNVTKEAFYGLYRKDTFAARRLGKIFHPRRDKMTFPLVSLVFVSILTTITWTGCCRLGSVSGHIYQSNDTVYNNEVNVCCQPLDRNIHITRGDPGPPYLIVHATGNYKIDGLPKGDYYLWIVAPNDNLFSDGARLISVRAFQETSNTDFELVAGGSISGHFLDENGNPLSSAGDREWVAMYNTLVSWEYTIYVAEDGTYSLRNLLPGEYQIYSCYSAPPHDEVVIIQSGKETHYDFFTRR